jgi:hypothetical protein
MHVLDHLSQTGDVIEGFVSGLSIDRITKEEAKRASPKARDALVIFLKKWEVGSPDSVGVRQRSVAKPSRLAGRIPTSVLLPELKL